MMVVVLALAMVAAAVGGIRNSRRIDGAGLPAHAAMPRATRRHVVVRGDTLWGIAMGLLGEGGGDPREVIHAIRKANNLSCSLIRPGQVLSIPAGEGAGVGALAPWEPVDPFFPSERRK